MLKRISFCMALLLKISLMQATQECKAGNINSNLFTTVKSAITSALDHEITTSTSYTLSAISSAKNFFSRHPEAKITLLFVNVLLLIKLQEMQEQRQQKDIAR